LRFGADQPLTVEAAASVFLGEVADRLVCEPKFDFAQGTAWKLSIGGPVGGGVADDLADQARYRIQKPGHPLLTLKNLFPVFPGVSSRPCRLLLVSPMLPGTTRLEGNCALQSRPIAQSHFGVPDLFHFVHLAAERRLVVGHAINLVMHVPESADLFHDGLDGAVFLNSAALRAASDFGFPMIWSRLALAMDFNPFDG
jgi:hypothetical protein